jgi:methyl-accepting chemotaxis protein
MRLPVFRVRTKVLAACAVPLAFTAALGWQAVVNLGTVNAHGARMYRDGVVPLRANSQARAGLADLDRQVQRSVAQSEQASAGAVTLAAREDEAQLTALIATYRTHFSGPDARRALAAYDSAWAAFREASGAVLAARARGDRADAASTYFAEVGPLAVKVDGALADLATLDANRADLLQTRSASTYSWSRLLTVLLWAAALLVGGTVSVLVAHGIVRRVRPMLAAAERIAEGDLDLAVDADGADEIGDMGRAFQRMIVSLRTLAAGAERIAGGDLSTRIVPASERDMLGCAFATMARELRELVSSVTTSAAQVTDASREMETTAAETGRAVQEIADATGGVAEGAERQVRSVAGARVLTGQVASATRESAGEAEETARVASEARAIATAGAELAAKASQVMETVRAASTEAADAIGSLGTKSQEIDGIVDTITGIAAQTNLLALNAAIEAARAGEQGRGFAVVADQVRTLAEESRAAAERIAAIVAEIQDGTTRAVGAVRLGGQRISEGAATVERTRESFAALGAGVEDMDARTRRIAEAVAEIAHQTKRMEAEITEVATVAEDSSTASEQVSAASQQTTASTQQVVAAAAELRCTAEELDELCGHFTL